MRSRVWSPRELRPPSDPRVAAIIVAAFSDPGLAELRASVQVPVFGIGEEVFREAAREGRQFGIVTVTPNPELIASFEAKAEELGFGAQYRGTRVTPGDPTELVKDPVKLDAALAAAVAESIERMALRRSSWAAPALRLGDSAAAAVRRAAGGGGQRRRPRRARGRTGPVGTPGSDVTGAATRLYREYGPAHWRASCEPGNLCDYEFPRSRCYLWFHVR